MFNSFSINSGVRTFSNEKEEAIIKKAQTIAEIKRAEAEEEVKYQAVLKDAWRRMIAQENSQELRNSPRG